MTMKEACAKTIENRKAQFDEHRALHRGHNAIRGFTQTEWEQQQTGMKSSYGAKAKKHSHNALWRHYSEKIETL